MPRTASSLERLFAILWQEIGGQPYVPEYRFAAPRRWRLDFAWPLEKVGLELEGGVWSGGRHTRGGGFAGDCEKYNAATLMGWRVLRYTGDDLKHRSADVLMEITKLLNSKGDPA